MSDNHGGAGEPAIIDVERMRALGAETGLGVRGVAELFLDQMGEQLDDLRVALLGGSEQAVAGVAHKCRGSSVLAGMEQLSALLGELEQAPGQALQHLERRIDEIERAFAAVGAELKKLAASDTDE